MIFKKLEDMDLIDDFLNTAVANYDPDNQTLYRIILEVLLNRKIGKVKIIGQRKIPGIDTDKRGIQLDVEITEYDMVAPEKVTNIYDYEPHIKNDYIFPKYNRFRQARIDSLLMKNGDNDFSHLKEIYIINITNFDPFKKNRMLYTFETSCTEDVSIPYDDGIHHLYFFAGGEIGGSKDIKNMLTYICNSNDTHVVDAATEHVNNIVKRVKKADTVRGDFMTWEEYFKRYNQEEREAACAEARNQGLAEGIIKSKIEDIKNLLSSLGPIPDNIESIISKESNPEVLSKWLRIAANSDSFENFENAIKI